MRKKQQETLDRKKYFEENFPEVSQHFKGFIAAFGKEDIFNIVKVEDFYLEKYGCYVSGYTNKENNKFYHPLTSFYYICECCQKKYDISRFRSFYSKKHEFGILCQKCATRKNTQKEEFKEKQKIATKKGWEEGRYNHLKENGYFLEWGRKHCRDILLKSEEEKKEIAIKKVNTWNKHSDEEKKEINKRRAKKFLENSKNASYHYVPFIKDFDKRFLTKDWYNKRNMVINRDKFTCQKCKKVFIKSKLSVHHLIPYRFCQNNDVENLITLCKSCHGKVEKFIEKNCILEENKIDVKKEMEFINEN